ncbi:MAG: hypothetical protein AB1696_04440 [Planctomycetota bacterium]
MSYAGIHRQLHVEELEARIAPATLSALNREVRYTDTTGDDVWLLFSGAGQADVLWNVGGANPNPGGDEIATIAFLGANTSTLSMRDTNAGVGGDTLTAGAVTAGAGESIGGIRVYANGGELQNTTINLDGDLGMFSVDGDLNQVDLTIGRKLGLMNVYGSAVDSDISASTQTTFFVTGDYIGGQINILQEASSIRVGGDFGAAGSGSLLDVAGVLRRVQVTGSVVESDIVAHGELWSAMIGGNVTGGSLIQSDYMARTLFVTGSVDASTLRTGGNLTISRIGGNLTNGSLLEIGGPAGTIMLSGGMDASTIQAHSDARTVMIRGALANGSLLDVGGTATSLQLMGGIAQSTLRVGRALNNAQIRGDVTNSIIDVSGPTGMLMVSGSMTNTDMDFDQGVRSLRVMGSVGGTTTLDVTGDVGMLWVNGPMTGTPITINGGVGIGRFQGGVTGGTITTSGHVGMLWVYNGATNSVMNFNGGADRVYLYGGMANSDVTIQGNVLGLMTTGGVGVGSDITVNGSLTTAMLRDGMTGGNLHVTNTVGRAMILGSMDLGSQLTFDSSTGMVMVSGGMLGGSSVTVSGPLMMGRVMAPRGGEAMEAGTAFRIGRLDSQFMTTGTFSGSLELGETAEKSLIMFGGDMAGEVIITGQHFGGIMVRGDITSTSGYSFLIQGDMTSSAYISVLGDASLGAPIRVFGTYDGDIRTSLGMLPNVFLVTDPGSQGKFQARYDNPAAFLFTDVVTAGQLLYRRYSDGVQNNNPDTVFAGIGQQIVLNPGDVYNFVDSDLDPVTVTYNGDPGSSIELAIVPSGLGEDIFSITYYNTTANSDVNISVGEVGNGVTTAGRIYAVGQVFGSLSVEGWIQLWTGGELAAGETILTLDPEGTGQATVGPMTFENNFAGALDVGDDILGNIRTSGSIIAGATIHSAGDLRAAITAPSGTIAGGVIDIDGIIDASNGGRVQTAILAGDTLFTYSEGADNKVLNLVGLAGAVGSQQGVLLIGGLAGQEGGVATNEARVNLDLYTNATSLDTTDINFNTANVGTIGATNITGAVESQWTMTGLGAGGTLTVSGNLANLTISAGALGGAVSAPTISGTVTAVAGVAGTGSITTTGDFNSLISSGSMNGDLSVGGSLTGPVNVSGNIGGDIIATVNIAGTIHATGNLQSTIQAVTGTLGSGLIDIDGIIDASSGGTILRNVMAGDSTFTYYEGASTKTVQIVGLGGAGDQGDLEIGGAAGQEGGNPAAQARANLTLAQAATSLTTTNITLNDLSVPNITTTTVGRSIEGAATMTNFDAGDTLSVTTALNNFTITGAAGLGGSITANRVIGTIDTGAGGVLNTGSVTTTGDLANMTTGAGDMAGVLQIGGDVNNMAIGSNLTGSLQIGDDLTTMTVGNVTGPVVIGGDVNTINMGGDLTGSLQIGGSLVTMTVGNVAGPLQIGGDLTDLTIGGDLSGGLRIGDDLLGNVAIAGDVTTPVVTAIYVGGDLLAGQSIVVQGDASTAGPIVVLGEFDGLVQVGASGVAPGMFGNVVIGRNVGSTGTLQGYQRNVNAMLAADAATTAQLTYTRDIDATSIVGDPYVLFGYQGAMLEPGDVFTFTDTTNDGVTVTYSSGPADSVVMLGMTVPDGFGRQDISSILYINADATSNLTITTDDAGNGVTTAGDVTAGGMVFGSFSVEGWINSWTGGELAAGETLQTRDPEGTGQATVGAMSFENNVAGTLSVGTSVMGAITSTGNFTGAINIGGSITAAGSIVASGAGQYLSAGRLTVGGTIFGSVETNIFSGTAFTWNEGGNPVNSVLVQGSGGVLRVDGSLGLSPTTGDEGLVNLTVNAAATGLTANNVDFWNINAPSIDATTINQNVLGTVTLAAFDNPDTFAVTGNLNNLTITGPAGLGGDITAANVTGVITTGAGGLLAAGSVATTADFESLDVGGDMNGTLAVGRDLTGSVSVTGNFNSQITVGRDIATVGAYSIGINGSFAAGASILVTGDASAGARMRFSGEFDGLARVGIGGAGMFGDVVVRTNAGSTGTLRAYADNNLAFLSTDAATAAQLTYTRDSDGTTNNDFNTLFGGLRINIGPGEVYTFTDSDGDTVQVRFFGDIGSSIGINTAPAGIGEDLTEVVYDNANANSRVEIDVTAFGPGSNQMTTSGMVNATGQIFGTFVIEGWIQGWTGGFLAAGESIATNQDGALGDITGVMSLEGDLDGTLTVAGAFAGGGLVLEGAQTGTITVGGVAQNYFDGFLHGGMNLGAGTIDPNPSDTFIVGGQNVRVFWDGVYDVSYSYLTPSAGAPIVTMLYADNHIDSVVSANVDFGSIRVDGRVKAVPGVTYNSGAEVSTGIGIDITNGDLGFLRLQKFDHPDYSIRVGGNLGSVLIVEEMLEGTIQVTGDLTGDIKTAAGQEIRGRITIGGDLSGRIMPGGDTTPGAGEDITGQIVVGGDMTGMIYAYDLGKDVVNGYDKYGVIQYWPLKGSITVGGNVTGGIDIVNTMPDYSFIEATGTIANATFDAGNNLLTGVRIQGLSDVNPLRGRITTNLGALNVGNITFTIGDNATNGTRDFLYNIALVNGGAGVAATGALTLDGRNLASAGWLNESPSLIINGISLADLNAVIGGITYDGAAGVFVSIDNVLLNDFTTAGAGTLTVLNVGALNIAAEALGAGDILNVVNVVHGTINLGANNMGGFIDIANNLVYDRDNGSDGYIVTTGTIANYNGTNTVGIRVNSLAGVGAVGGRIRTAYGDFDALRSFSIGEGGVAIRTFQSIDMGMTQTFDLMLDGRTINPDFALWTLESPTMILTGGSLSMDDWETIRTFATMYDGAGALDGLSISGATFDTWNSATDFTTYNLGNVTFLNTAPVPEGDWMRINNDLWGALNIGNVQTGNYLMAGDIVIGHDLTGSINFMGRFGQYFTGPNRIAGTITIGNNFAEGAEIDYSPGDGRSFLGTVTVAGDWVGVLDINGINTHFYYGATTDASADIRIGGNFGAPTVTGSLVDIEAGVFQTNSWVRGLSVGTDNTGIMYGDLYTHRNFGAGGSINYYFRNFIGTASSANGDAYMAHTARFISDSSNYASLYIYGGGNPEAMQGQILALNGGNMYVATQVYNGGMSDQGEVRILNVSGWSRDNITYGMFNGQIQVQGPMAGVLAVGDGYTGVTGPPAEAFATFGRDFRLYGVTDFSGVIRSFGQGTWSGGEWQGVPNFGDIDITGNMSGQVLGYYVVDVEVDGAFSGEIDAYASWRGGALRIAGANTGTIRGSGQDLAYYSGTLTSGSPTLTLNTTGGGILTMTRNTTDVPYSYLYSGTGNTIEMLRVEGGNAIQTVLGTGVTLNSFWSENVINGGADPRIDLDDDPLNNLDTGLHSVRLANFTTGRIEVEGALGQFVIPGSATLSGTIATTAGSVTTAGDPDMTGVLFVNGNASFEATFVMNLAGDIRENAGFYGNSWNVARLETGGQVNIGGNMNGILVFPEYINGDINITGNMGAIAQIMTNRTNGQLGGSIDIGGNMAGNVYIGTNVAHTNADLEGTFHVGGSMIGNAALRIYGDEGIKGTIAIDGNMQDNALIYTYDSAADLTGTVTIGSIQNNAYIFINDDLTGLGQITVTGDITGTRAAGAIDINGEINSMAPYSISVGGRLAAGSYIDIRENAELGAEIRLLGEFDGRVYVGSGGAGFTGRFGNVTVAPNPGSTGTLRARNDNDAATLTSDSFTAGLLTYTRDIDAVTNNDPNTLFGIVPPPLVVLNPGDSITYFDSDGDQVRVDYAGPVGSTVTLNFLTGGWADVDTVTYAGADATSNLSFTIVTQVGNGATTAGDVFAAGQVFGSFTVEGWIESWTGGQLVAGETISTLPGGIFGDVGAMSLEGDLAGSLITGDDLTGWITVGGVINNNTIDIGGVIQGLSGGGFSVTLPAGNPSYSYRESGVNKTVAATNLVGGTFALTVGGAAGQEGGFLTNAGRANLNLGAGTADALASTGVTMFDVTAQTITTTNAPGIEGTLTLATFGATDTLNLTGNLGSMTIGAGNMAGQITVGGNLTGQIAIPGAITTAGAYSISVGGNVTATGGIQAVGSAAAGAELRFLGEMDGLIRVGSGGAGTFGNVTIATNPGSTGTMRAFARNMLARLTTDSATANQLTYIRDTDAQTSNNPLLLFGADNVQVINPGGSYNFTDSDGDSVTVTYAAGSTGQVTLELVSIGLGQDIFTTTYAGATAASNLDISVTAVVGNGITTAGQVTATGQVFGTFTIDGSVGSWIGGQLVEGERLYTSDDVGSMSLEGAITGILEIGGDLNGAMAFQAAGFLGGGMIIHGSVSPTATITIGGVAQTYYGNLLHGGRNVNGTPENPNPSDTTTLGASTLRVFWDGVYDVNYGFLTPNNSTVSMFYADNHLDSVVSSGLSFTSMRIDGRVKAVSDIIKDSGSEVSTGRGIDIAGGSLNYLRLYRFDHPDYTIQVDGNIGTIRIVDKMLEGTIRTINGGDLTGDIITAAGQEIRGRIEINGDIMAGARIMPGGDTTMNSGEDISGQIVVGGAMNGSIYAYDLGKDVANGEDKYGNPQVWALKGGITVGGAITGLIDITNTMMDYSFIQAGGTIADYTGPVGIRIQGLGGGALPGRITFAMNTLDLATNFTWGVDGVGGTRTLNYAGGGLPVTASMTLDGRNIGGGWAIESPSLTITASIALADLNTILNAVTYNGVTHSALTPLASVASATIGVFDATNPRILNVGNLTITDVAGIAAGERLTVVNDVWGWINVGTMNGFIDIGGNLVYDRDNGSDGYIGTPGGTIINYDGTNTRGIRVNSLGAAGRMGGRIWATYGNLDAVRSFSIGEGGAAIRTFATADLNLTHTFALMLDGRTVNPDFVASWSLESPTLIRTGGALTLAEWETIRTSAGTTYRGVAAANGLSLSASGYNFAAYTNFTTYNLGDLGLTNAAVIGAANTMTINNDLWGALNIGDAATANTLLDGDIYIGADLMGSINFRGAFGINGLLDIRGSFAEGAEIDYTIGGSPQYYYGDIAIQGDWLGVLDMNGTDVRLADTGGNSWDINIYGNFGSPTVHGTLIDIENAYFRTQDNNRGLRIGTDSSGIMYGDVWGRTNVGTDRGYFNWYSGSWIGTAASGNGDAYMAHTSRWIADQYHDNRLSIYGGGNPNAMQGQIISRAINDYPFPFGDNSYLYVYNGGMSDQGEIRSFGTRRSTWSFNRDQIGLGSFRGSYTINGLMAGAIVAGDGYGDDALATFGSNFSVSIQDSGPTQGNFTGVIRSLGRGVYDANGEFQGVMNHGDITIAGTTVSGQILGYFVVDTEIFDAASNFTGRIEAFDSFRGGALWLNGANNGVIRAGGQDMTYVRGTIAAGATLNLAFGGGTLDVTADPGNAGATTYSYVYSGSGERVQALRFEDGARDIASIVGSGVILESIQIEGNLDNNGAAGSITLSDNAANGLDSGLRSLRVNIFEGGDTIYVEGEFGQFIINTATANGFVGDVTTTPGPVADSGADLTGVIFMRATQNYAAASDFDFGGDIRQQAGFWSYAWWNSGFNSNLRVRGDHRGVLVFPNHMDGNIVIDGDMRVGAWFQTQRTPDSHVNGNITIGGDMAGYLYIGDGTDDTTADLAGDITIGGDLAGYLNIYGDIGITATGSITVGGQLTGQDRYIYLRDAVADVVGSISIAGGIGTTAYIYIPDDVIGTITIGGSITSRRTAGVIDIGGDILTPVGPGAYSISVNNMSPGASIIADGNASAGAEMRINGDFDGLIQIGNAAAEMFGNVFVAPNPSSTGTLRAYDDNNAATLTSDVATKSQLTYWRQSDGTINNDYNTLFGPGAGTVLNPGDPAFSYTDSDGDTVEVTYAAGGAGTVTLYFVAAGLGQDLVDIVYAGATSDSELMIQITAAVGNGITTAGNVHADGQTFGTFQVQGWLESWTGGILAAGETLSTDYFNANGDVTGILSLEELGGTLNVGGVVTGGLVDIQGNTLAGSTIVTAANGFYDSGLLIGGAQNVTIVIGGVGYSYAGGQLHGGRNITGTAEDPNPFDVVNISGNNVYVFWDGVRDVGYGIIYNGATVASAYVSDDIDSFVASNLNFQSIRIDGRVKANPDIVVGDGTISNTGVGLDITNGNVNFLRLDQFDHPDYTVRIDGDLGEVRITSGMLEGTIRTINGGNLTGEIWTAAGQEIRGRIEIDGDITASGAIMPGGTTAPISGEDITGQIVVNGNMAGAIYAYDLGKDVANGYDKLGNPQVWPLKGSITVGGAINGLIDITNTMMDYSFIQAGGTIADYTGAAGIRIQGLGGGALPGRITLAMNPLNVATTFTWGVDGVGGTRTFNYAGGGPAVAASVTLDGRNIGGGWALESPSLTISAPVTLGELNTILNAVTYAGATHGALTPLASVAGATINTFDATNPIILNVGNLTITDPIGAGETLTIANDVWGTINLGANAMNGLIDVGGNLVYDVDNGSDGWIYSTGRIANFTGAAGVRVQGLGGTGVMGGRITTALNQPALTAANTFIIGDDAAAGTRIFTTPIVSGLAGLPEFRLTLDGRFYNAGDSWAYESPTLELYAGSITGPNWETIRTSGITYDGQNAAGGLSLAGTQLNPVQFPALASNITMYNLGGYVRITGNPAIPNGVTVNILNTLWGDLTVGTYGNGNVAVAGGGTIAIGKDLTGDINLVARMLIGDANERSTISIGRNFTEGAEIDYTPYNNNDFQGDITVLGDWVGLFDVNGQNTDVYRRDYTGAEPATRRGSSFLINGNFGAPTVTTSLFDIADGRVMLESTTGLAGMRIGYDGTGIMYGDVFIHAPRNDGGTGSYYNTPLYIGRDGVTLAGQAYMDHTARLICERFEYAAFYIYGAYYADAFQGQILGATRNTSVDVSGIGLANTIYVYGGSTDQAEIRSLRAPYRDNYGWTPFIQGGMNAGITFRNTFRGAIAVGDGYDTNEWPASEPYPEETYANFGRTSSMNFAEGGMTGIIRSFGRDHEVVGVPQGSFQYCEIDVGSSGNLTGLILGYYIPDIEMDGGFTGRIEAFKEFRGGGVRITGVNTGTIRADNTDLTYAQGTLAAGATWNQAFGNGALSVTADPANGGAMTYSYLYAGTGEIIEALRFDDAARNISSVIGSGITMNSLFAEGRLVSGTGFIDLDDDPADGLDSALHSVRLRFFNGGGTERIEVEGELGQVVIVDGVYNGSITTTVGPVGASADLIGVIHNRAGFNFAGGIVDIAGSVRENAGLLAYYEMQNSFTFNVGGDMNGIIVCYRQNAATINIAGNVNNRGTIRTFETTPNIAVNMWVGGNFGGYMQAGDSETADICAISGTITIDGQFTNTARIYAMGTLGITGTITVGDGAVGIQNGGIIRTYRGPLSGSITVNGDILGGGEAIRVGTGNYDGANITATGSITVNGNLFGAILVDGRQAVTMYGIEPGGSITVNGSVGTNPGVSDGYIFLRSANSILAGTITVTGNIEDNAFIKIENDVTSIAGTGAINVLGDIASTRNDATYEGAIDIDGAMSGTLDITGSLLTRVNIDGNADAGNEIQIRTHLSGILLANLFGDVRIWGNFMATGQITANNPGVGNTLTVDGAESGTVTPANAFQFYV